MIAETAYFLAQERGFTGGDPVSDWIEAERRVDRQLCGARDRRACSNVSSLGSRRRPRSWVRSSAAFRRSRQALAPSLNADVEKLDGLKLVLRSKLDELRERGDQVSQTSAASGREHLERAQ